MCYNKKYSKIYVNRVCISSAICCVNIDLYSMTVEKENRIILTIYILWLAYKLSFIKLFSCLLYGIEMNGHVQCH